MFIKMIFFSSLQKYFVKRPLLSILFFSLILRLFYLTLNNPLWWDAYVYIGIGKFIYSSGQIGMWESFRPLIHPFLLGSVWRLGLDPVFFGKFFDLIFSLIGVYLVYLIGKKLFDVETGLIAAVIFSFAPLFMMFTGLILTEPLAIVLSLLGFYFWLKALDGKSGAFVSFFLAGFFFGFSFLSKFPQGLFFFGASLMMLFRSERVMFKIKNLMMLTSGFCFLVVPYLFLNNYLYQNPFEPFTSGSWIVTTATWMYGSGLMYYFTHFFLSSPLYLFFFFYLYLFFKQRYYVFEGQRTLVFITVVTLAYFMYVPRKEVRYLVTILPFISLIVAAGLIYVYRQLKKSSKPVIRPKAFVVVCCIFLLIHIPTTIHFEKVPSFEPELKMIIEKYDLRGPVLSSDPSFVSFIDEPVFLLSGMSFAEKVYNAKRGHYSLFFVNDCDLICSPENITCFAKKKELLDMFALDHKEIFKEEHYFKSQKMTCTYFIYLPHERIINSSVISG